MSVSLWTQAHTYALIQWGFRASTKFSEPLSYGTSLLLEDFHEHWRVERSADRTPLDPRLFVKEPRECTTKGCVSKRKRQYLSGNSITR
jgi:hypothetical protein